VLVAAEDTGSYGAVLADVLEEVGYRAVEAPTPRRERGRGKTDTLDALLAARSTLSMPLMLLRDRRTGDAQAALQVLTVARDQLNADRLPCINALTALVRSRHLGAFAQIAGTCPIPASSGNTVRHRLNRGGDRQLNRAINTIVLTRMRTDPRHPRIRHQATSRGQDEEGDPPLPQALYQPPDLPHPQLSTPSPNVIAPAA
jgi:transposase